MKKLTIENCKELLPWIEAADYKEYNSNIVTMLMWSFRYEMWFEVQEHFALVAVRHPQDERIWLPPYCEKAYRKQALLCMERLSKEEQISFEIHSMTKEFKNWLSEQFPLRFLISSNYDAQDYVYDRFQQESLSGKKMQKRRNHYNAFINQYKDRMRYKPLEKDDFPAVLNLLNKWRSGKKEEEKETIDDEEWGIRFLLAHFDELPLSGGCIYIDQELEAFSITSLLSRDTVQIHVEKANKQIRGLYVAILKLFLETLGSEVRYVNREDDMGLAELRKAKHDMHPICKIEKFAAEEKRLRIRQADADWKQQIEKLWISRFPEESEESTRTYFSSFYKEEDCWLLTCENTLLCMLQNREMSIMLNGKKERVSLIFAVATDPSYEGCGYMRMLLEHVLTLLAKKQRYVFIQAYNWDLYRSFGFHEQYEQQTWKLKKQAYDSWKGSWRRDGEAKTLLSLYEQYCQKKNGWRIRDTSWYEKRTPYLALWKQHFLIYEVQGQARGYLLLEEEEQSIHIHECIYDSEETLAAMLSYFHEDPRSILIDTDMETVIEGRYQQQHHMMVKELDASAYPKEHLFLHEEL